jgi:hypothetical protein
VHAPERGASQLAISSPHFFFLLARASQLCSTFFSLSFTSFSRSFASWSTKEPTYSYSVVVSDFSRGRMQHAFSRQKFIGQLADPRARVRIIACIVFFSYHIISFLSICMQIN